MTRFESSRVIRALPIVTVALAGLLSAGCTFQEKKGGGAGALSFEQIASASLSYSTVSNFVIRQACADCHGSQGGVSLDTYAGLKANLADAYNAAVVRKSMPKDSRPRLTACQGRILKMWMDAGAPEVGTTPIGAVAECASAGGGETPPVPPPTLPPPSDRLDFAAVRARVFAPNCIRCHGSRGGVGFETYEDAKSNAIDAYSEAVENGTMPPPRSGVALLTPCQAKLLKAWIDADAPETNAAPIPDIPECAPPALPPPPPPVAPPAPGPTRSELTTETTISYAVVNALVFQPVCVECHGAAKVRGNTRLDSYAEAKTNAIPAYDQAVVLREMPPSARPPLDACQQALLRLWKDAGAPETTERTLGPLAECGLTAPPAPPVVAPPPAPPAIPATFAYFVGTAYPRSCALCHDPGGRADDVVLNSAAALISGGYVTPGDAEGSSLYKRVTRPVGARGRMPPASAHLPDVSADEAAALKAWIEAGAQP